MVIFLDILYFWFGFWGEFLGIVGLGLVLTWVFGLLQFGGGFEFGGDCVCV